VALAAAVGLEMIAVRRQAEGRGVSQRDELVEPGAPLPAGAINDSNRALIASLLRSFASRSQISESARRSRAVVERLAASGSGM